MLLEFPSTVSFSYTAEAETPAYKYHFFQDFIKLFIFSQAQAAGFVALSFLFLALPIFPPNFHNILEKEA